MPLRSCGLDRRQRSLFSLEHQRSKRRRMDTKANREILNVEKNTWPSKKCQMTSHPPQRMPHSPPPFPYCPGPSTRTKKQNKRKPRKNGNRLSASTKVRRCRADSDTGRRLSLSLSLSLGSIQKASTAALHSRQVSSRALTEDKKKQPTGGQEKEKLVKYLQNRGPAK